MNISVEEITPAIATDLLACNDKNRSLNKNHVRFLADQMRAGQWQMAGDPIRISQTGRLLDGQHRLSAIVDCELPVTLVVIRDLPDETFHVMDTGRIRSAADVLSADGVANATTTASSVRMILNYQRGTYSLALGQSQGRKRGVVTNSEVVAFLSKQNITEFVKRGMAWYLECRLFTASEYALLYYVFNGFDSPGAIHFLSSLASGASLEATSPIFLLRKKLEQYRFNKISCPSSERLALSIKAWNLYRSEKTVSLLAFNPAKEDFPQPI